MFFSVKSSIKIGNKVYTPCICYEAGEMLAPTIEKLVRDGKARIHNNRVFFQNGKILEKKADEPDCDKCDNNLGKGYCAGNSKNGLVDTTGEGKCFEKSKKSKSEKKAPVDDEIPSPEEIADEGF